MRALARPPEDDTLARVKIKLVHNPYMLDIDPACTVHFLPGSLLVLNIKKYPKMEAW